MLKSLLPRLFPSAKQIKSQYVQAGIELSQLHHDLERYGNVYNNLEYRNLVFRLRNLERKYSFSAKGWNHGYQTVDFIALAHKHGRHLTPITVSTYLDNKVHEDDVTFHMHNYEQEQKEKLTPSYLKWTA